MATLKDHQQAMVDLLASGSGIPASASRLAHAMHDVLKFMTTEQLVAHADWRCQDDVTTTPASVMSLTHAMHDVLGFLPNETMHQKASDLKQRIDATTPGLNDKAISKREKLLKTDSPAKWPTPAERRVKELENTVKQLRGANKKLRGERDMLHGRLLEHEHPTEPEQAGCRKPDTQVCNHHDVERIGNEIICCNCGAKR